MKTVYDIESLCLQRFEGFRRGELVVMAASNQTARSYFTNKINMELFRVNHQPRNPYKFSRQWHEVDLPWRSDEQLAWCAEQFGPHPRQADAWCRWCVDAFTVKFRDLRDYNWYMLRWGSE